MRSPAQPMMRIATSKQNINHIVRDVILSVLYVIGARHWLLNVDGLKFNEQRH